jgi:hypothetical protein
MLLSWPLCEGATFVEVAAWIPPHEGCSDMQPGSSNTQKDGLDGKNEESSGIYGEGLLWG